jgi:predicted AlkP superfamily pyrophosphatase or phosphodiesterase
MLAPAFCLPLLWVGLSARAAPPDESLRLVLLLVVDQLRPDRLDAALPGALGRLAREGRAYRDAVVDHAVTDTCPGHASVITGRHPSAAGIPGNDFIDRETGAPTYCVADPADDARVFGSHGGRSPRNLRATTLGDWMKQTRPGTRVFSVAGKDRAAIVLGGQNPDAAYWFNRSGQVGFTTSRYYGAELAPWIVAFNSALFDGMPETWTHEVASGVPAARPDDFPGESTDYERTSGHPLLDGDPEKLAKNLYHTPYLDQITLAFAAELVEREGLGRGPGPDLLALSLSSVDTVGHQYGPYSHESRDTVLRLDRELDRFMGPLRSRWGEEGILVALTSDHGVLPLPEWLRSTGGLECPDESGRPRLRMLMLRLLWKLHVQLDGFFSLPRRWLVQAGPYIAVPRSVAEEAGIPVEDVVALVESQLERVPSIARAWTAEEIRDEEGELAELYRHSFVADRSGDLVVQPEPTCLISRYVEGTTHGTPYAYDRRVPLLFWGSGVEAGSVAGRAATIDIAPTLARRLGIAPPADLDGRSLFDGPR